MRWLRHPRPARRPEPAGLPDSARLLDGELADLLDGLWREARAAPTVEVARALVGLARLVRAAQAAREAEYVLFAEDLEDVGQAVLRDWEPGR